MIIKIINDLSKTILDLQNAVEDDIEDVKKANHDALIARNEIKIVLMDMLQSSKEKLNIELSVQYNSGEDISKYRDNIDQIEISLRKLYELNGRLASIVLPVKEMYKDIIDEISSKNGGSLIEVMA